MPRLPPLALAALTTLAAGVSGLALRSELRARASGLQPGTELVGLELFSEGLASIVVLFLVGRLALSVMPPGLPAGRGATGALSAWGLAHLVGFLALGATVALERALGLPLSAWGIALPWLVVLALRLVTLPGGLVPRHALDSEPPTPAATAARAALGPLAITPVLILITTPRLALPLPEVPPDAAAEALAVLVGRGGELLLPAAHLAALLTLLARGLAAARRAPAGRAAVLLVFALTPLVALAPADGRGGLATALVVCGGAATTILWLRRADARGLTVAVLCFAGAPLAGPLGVFAGTAGLVALLAATPRPGRRKVVRVLVPALLLVSVPAVALLAARWGGAGAFVDALAAGGNDPAAAGAALRDSAGAHTAWGLGWPLVAAALAWGALGKSRPLDEAGEADPPGREFPALAGLLLGTALAAVWLGGVSTAPPVELLLVLAPVGALTVGLALVRGERAP